MLSNEKSVLSGTLSALFSVALAAIFSMGSVSAQETTYQSQSRQNQGEVVVYTAHDRQFSEPLLREFERRSGITVKPVYDTEAVKTVGLVNRLLAERNRPRCDVFWNNEIIRSIQLREEGLTEAYHSPSAEHIPSNFKDPEGHWTGFGARARIIMVNKDILPNEEDWPRRIDDLTYVKWKGQAAFAKPLFGTTNTHAAVIWATAGPEKAKEFWRNTLKNSVMEAGNAQARDAARDGELAWCLTDTDDARGALIDGANVALVLPESGPSGQGTLLIPNTVVLIKGGPNTDNGKLFIDFLLSEEVETELALGRAGQIPVRASVSPPKDLPSFNEENTLQVDWQKAYEAIAPSTEFLVELIAEMEAE